MKDREAAARNGVPALERAAEEIADLHRTALSERQRQAGGKALQWAMGIGAGVTYAALRESLPGEGVRRGLLYGALFSLVVDEALTPMLGLAPGPAAFPWQTHVRGFAGHLVFGGVAELTMQALQGSAALRRGL